MASCKLGHIYVVPTVLTKPPKDKYALCVCVADGFFVWINTDARPHNRDQMAIPAGCHDLVSHDSFLDLSRVVCHPARELAAAEEHACISDQFCLDIIDRIRSGLDMMPPRHAEIIIRNLRDLLARTL